MWVILRRVLLVAVALAAAATVAWYLYGRSCKREFESRIEALRAAGEPTRFEDVAGPPIPDEENAARLLEEADRLLQERKRDSTKQDDLLYKTAWSTEERASVAAYLDSLAPYYEMLARVPERPGWWLGRENIRRADTFAPANDARIYLVRRVEFDEREPGRTQRAADAAVLLLDLGDKCRVPGVLGYVIGQSFAYDVGRVLDLAMRRPGFDPALFRGIVDARLSRAIRDRGPSKSSLMQERVVGIDFVNAIRDGNTSNYALRDGTKPVSFFRLPSFYKDAGRFLDLEDYVIAHSDLTPEDSLLAAAELRRQFGAHDAPDTLPGDYAAFWSRLFENYPKHVARARLVRVVTALLEFRQQERKWPEDLAAPGEIPVDPYGGKPFLYERTEHGCRVASAKHDAKDDHDFLAWTLEDDQIPAMPR